MIRTALQVAFQNRGGAQLALAHEERSGETSTTARSEIGGGESPLGSPVADWNKLRSSGDVTTLDRSSVSPGSVGGWDIRPLGAGIRSFGTDNERGRSPEVADERIPIRESYSVRLNMSVFRRDGIHAPRERGQARCYDGAPKRLLDDTPQNGMGSIFNHTFGRDKLNTLLQGLEVSDQTVYKSSWRLWGDFCNSRAISYWMTPGAEGWGEHLMDFLMWGAKILHRAPSTLEIRRAVIRFSHVIHGFGDFSTKACRARALMKGIAKTAASRGKRHSTRTYYDG